MDVKNDGNSELLRTIAHPSVRIKGTEDNFSPVPCTDPECSNKIAHMHCPFCVKTDLYHDPRILKAHYRVKHVDKGIDFGGLKMLRCCEHCDIVGVIKGEKKFKGAHWHCYKCKNGFNRRDEAFKHYKTHFRHPYTTFQIHIPQEVNGAVIVQERRDDMPDISDASINYTVASIIANGSPLHTDTILRKPTNEMNNTNSDGSLNMSLSEATNEGQPAIMIIQEECIDGSHCNTLTNNDAKDNAAIQRLVLDLQEQNDKLKLEMEKREKTLTAEIEHLKSQIQLQSQELQRLRQREQELSNQLTVPMDTKMRQLINSLQVQHTEMLHQHLLQVKKEAYLSAVKDLQSSAIMTTLDANSATNSNLLSTRDQSVIAVVLDNTSGLLSQAIPVSSYNLTSVSHSQCSERATVATISQLNAQTLPSGGSVSLALSSAPVLSTSVNNVGQPIVTTASVSTSCAPVSRSNKSSFPVISQSPVLLTIPSTVTDGKVTGEHITLSSAGSDSNIVNSAKHILTPSTTPLIISSANNSLSVSQSFPLTLTNEALSNLRTSLTSTSSQSLLMAVHPDSTTPLLVRNCSKSLPLGIVMREPQSCTQSNPKSAPLSNEASLSGYLTACNVAVVNADSQELYAADSTSVKNEISGDMQRNVASHLANSNILATSKQLAVCPISNATVDVLTNQEQPEKRKSEDVASGRDKKRKETMSST